MDYKRTGRDETTDNRLDAAANLITAPADPLIACWGPGATPAEYLIQLVLPGAVTVAAYLHAQAAFSEWPWWKLLIYCVLVFDIVGGIVTNATSTAKRWFHREAQTWRDHLGFIALHFLQVAVIAMLFRDFDWAYGVFLSAYLIGAAGIILLLPLYLQRPVAPFPRRHGHATGNLWMGAVSGGSLVHSISFAQAVGRSFAARGNPIVPTSEPALPLFLSARANRSGPAQRVVAPRSHAHIHDAVLGKPFHPTDI